MPENFCDNTHFLFKSSPFPACWVCHAALHVALRKIAKFGVCKIEIEGCERSSKKAGTWNDATSTVPDFKCLFKSRNDYFEHENVTGSTKKYVNVSCHPGQKGGFFAPCGPPPGSATDIPFLSNPPLSLPSYRKTSLSSEQRDILKEITDLKRKQAIQLANPRSLSYYSQVFVVPKKNSGWRPIINLKGLNSYIHTPHFKLENIHSLKDVLLLQDYVAKTDLKDAYLTQYPCTTLCHTSFRYLRFSEWNIWVHTPSTWTCSSFSPLHKVTQTCSSFLEKSRNQDSDILLMVTSAPLLKQQLSLTMDLLKHLCFILNTNNKACPENGIPWVCDRLSAMTLSFSQSKVFRIQRSADMPSANDC